MTAAVVALVALIALVWAVNPLGDDAVLPSPLEEVFPLPGDTVVRQTAVEVDLPVGYSATFIVDGIKIPQIEMGVTQATGRFLWQPSPTTLFQLWTTGDHTVTVEWQRVSGGGPDPGSFTWTFRII
jgi:hypothetical protein